MSEDPVFALIAKVRADDEGTAVFAPSGGLYRLREAQYTQELADALAHNTKLRELRLVDCGLTDASARLVAQALAHNAGVAVCDLSRNRIGAEGLAALAETLRTNAALAELVLLDIPRVGEQTAALWCDALEHSNTTLVKVTWRLETRSSTRLNSFLTRNRDTARRLKRQQQQTASS